VSEAPAVIPVRERTPAAILAALAVNVLDRLQRLDPTRRIEVLQIAIALTAAEIQQRVREAQLPRDE
jgi:hypothetical protein